MVGGCPPSSQLGATRAPLAPPLPSHSPLPNLIFGGPKWPYVPFGGAASLGGGGHNQWLLQAPAPVIKPSLWIFMACLAEKETGVIAMWPLRFLFKKPAFFFFSTSKWELPLEEGLQKLQMNIRIYKSMNLLNSCCQSSNLLYEAKFTPNMFPFPSAGKTSSKNVTVFS